MSVATAKKTYLVDCDVHEHIRSAEQLLPYLDARWHSWIALKPDVLFPYELYLFPQGGMRKDLLHEDGTNAGMYPDEVLGHIQKYDVDYAFLTNLNYGLSAMPQAQYATALASAYNDWLIAELLPRYGGLRGSISVAAQLPDEAAREIDRVGGHPQMGQLILGIYSPELAYGNEFFDPIWAACVRNDLPVALHLLSAHGLFSRAVGGGYPHSYSEQRGGYYTVFETQLVSMVMNGVFERFGGLRVAFVEGGFAWAPNAMWRMDDTWASSRNDATWLKRPPSDYVREHIRFTTQPLPEPERPEYLLKLIDMMGSDELLMFSSDFPHWDFDSPLRALPPVLSQDLREKVLWKNAMAFYRLPEPTHERLEPSVVPPFPPDSRSDA
jgi:uncharacterized protein